MTRRNFTRAQKEQIVERARIDGIVRCEGCKLALKPGAWEIDHIIAEALRPEADKRRPITIAEGQLLGRCCHRGEHGKTNADVAKIAKAKRQYDRANSMKTRPKSKIPSPPKQPRQQTKTPLPPKQLFRNTRRSV